jgi:ribose transport system substrate-binding protein
MLNRLNWISLALITFSLLITPRSSIGDEKKLKLAFVTNNSADFWTVCRAGCNKAAEENPNIQVEFQMLGDATAEGQKRVLDNLLAKGVDGIAISPVDPANETPMLNDAAQQAAIFCADSDAPNSARICYLGTNNVDAGKQAGGLIKEALPNGGKIMLFVGKLDAQNAKDRISGIKQALEGSNVQIISTLTDDTDVLRAKTNAQDTLVKYPDIAALVGLWSYNGPAILGAVRDGGKTGQVKIICFDSDDDTIAGIKSGDIYATVVQQPFEFGRLSMLNLSKYINGDKSFIPDSKQIFIPTIAIKKDNVEQFDADRKKLKAK